MKELSKIFNDFYKKKYRMNSNKPLMFYNLYYN